MIYGEKVTLRELELDDIKKMSLWDRNPDILFEDYDFPELDEREQRLWFQSKTSYGKKCFVVLDNKARIIGYIALRRINPVNKSGEIGIILNPRFHNLGLGTEIINTFLSWYFIECGYKSLFLSVGEYNKRAIRCYEKVGFRIKKRIVGEFNNYVVNLEEEEYRGIRDLFVIDKTGIKAKCFRMIITREEYEKTRGSNKGE